VDVAQYGGCIILRVIVANFGNDSVALMAYAAQHKWSQIYVVSVDTGFAHPDWSERVGLAERYARSLGFTVLRLTAQPDFVNLVRAQGEFPTPKFQWCAVYLKGDTLRLWLEQVDPLKTAEIILPRRRSHSPQFAQLPEYLEQDESFAERRIWHPLYQHSELETRALVETTPLDWLPHRSLECDPCVNSSIAALNRADSRIQARVAALEHELGEPFLQKTTVDKPFIFDMGCGSPYGCGL
jgi:3'-phosphoadenosine 5'-phosphosulfate sulfotransferase (PAPS reductase)/FAD synthetase